LEIGIMLTKTLLLYPLLCLAFMQPTNEEKAKKDLERMQGTWTMHALEVDGKPVPEEKLKDTTLTVKGDDYRTKIKDKEPPGFQLKLDPSKNPQAVDMIQKQPDGTEKVIKGIYTFENDTLKICRGLNPQQERPNQFATWPETSYFVVTWKKK
jgi:uncharacterized protein (TIGR03067 family)